MAHKEKRKYLRLWRARIKMVHFIVSSGEVGVICKNISGGGMLLCSSTSFPKGAQLEYEIELPGWKKFCQNEGVEIDSDTLKGSFRVIHTSKSSDGNFNIGVEFLDKTEAEKKLLNLFIVSHAVL